MGILVTGGNTARKELEPAGVQGGPPQAWSHKNICYPASPREKTVGKPTGGANKGCARFKAKPPTKVERSDQSLTPVHLFFAAPLGDQSTPC